MVDIIVFHITRLNIALENTITSSNPVLDILLVLEDTCGLVAPEITYGFAIRGAVELAGVIVEHRTRCTVDDTILVGNVTYLILIIGSIDIHIVTEILTNAIVPSQTDLNTSILDITTIDIGSTGTYSRQYGRLNKPVLRSLDVEVEVYIQTLVEEAGVETEVELLRGLPGNLIVAQTSRNSTPVRFPQGLRRARPRCLSY